MGLITLADYLVNDNAEVQSRTAALSHVLQQLDAQDLALLSLLDTLARHSHRFVTITPASHRRVLARRYGQMARSLADVFGWSMPFELGLLPDDLLAAMRAAGVLDGQPPLYRSKLRASALGGNTYLHSAFPTTSEDAVFFGPDSYRFANLIVDELKALSPPPHCRIVDIGVGAGVGAVTAATCCPSAKITATDINPKALGLARINALAAGFAIETVETSGLDGLAGEFDVVLLNPPYIMDDGGRSYRDGGAMHGAQLPLDLTLAGLERLAPKGMLILYSGSPIVKGCDALKSALLQAADDHGCTLRYRETDPDVFGEELDGPNYAEVERIALISAIFTRDR